MRWSVAGRGLVTAATANHVSGQLWNPSSTRSVYVSAISCAISAATASHIAVGRSSARGATPTSTVTPTIASDFQRLISPPSAAVLELATFSTQPTLDGVPVYRFPAAAATGSGFVIPFETKELPGIEVLPGAGLCVFTPVATALQPADITFFCYE